MALLPLNEIDEKLRPRVVGFYVDDFDSDFRVAMDGHITNIKWDEFVVTRFLERFSKALSAARAANKLSVSLFERYTSASQKYTTRFKQCMIKEVELCQSKTRKRGRQTTSHYPATTSSSSGVATIAKQPHVYAATASIFETKASLSPSPSPSPNQHPNPMDDQTSFTAMLKAKSVRDHLAEVQSYLLTLTQWLVAATNDSLSLPDSISGWQRTASEMLSNLQQISRILKDELAEWDLHKRRLANEFEHNDERFDSRSDKFEQQAFAAVRAVYIDRLNDIEQNAQAAVSYLYDVMDSAARWYKLGQRTLEITSIDQGARALISDLTRATFIVWRQSEQVIKAGNKFKATVRLLVGPALRLDAPASAVTVTMLTSEQIKSRNQKYHHISRSPCVPVTSEPSSVHLQKVTQPTDYDTSVMRTGPAGRRGKANYGKAEQSQPMSMFAEFPDITWKNDDRRSAKKENELTVCELKYAALFQTVVSINGEALILTCFSLPLVLIVHASQECHAHGTIFYDNAFSEKNREPFVVPDRVDWLNFSDKFFRWFASQTHVECTAIAKHNVEFIRSCVVEKGSEEVSFAQFYRNRLEWPIKLNFWYWIYNVRKLICEDLFLQFLWQQGAVYGFATHDRGERLLAGRRDRDTMLLRFSTSAVMRKSVAHVGVVIMIARAAPNGQTVVRSLMPAVLDDLKGIVDLRKRMLAHTVTRTLIYPNIAWKSSLLPVFERRYHLDQKQESIGHYIDVDIGIGISISEECSDRNCDDGMNDQLNQMMIDFNLEPAMFGDIVPNFSGAELSAINPSIQLMRDESVNI